MTRLSAKKLQNRDESGESNSMMMPRMHTTLATMPLVSAEPMGMSFFAQRFAKIAGMSPFSAA